MLKKKTVRKKVVNKMAKKPFVVKTKLSGFKRGPTGLYIPDKLAPIVPPGRLRQGFAKAKEEINGIIDEIIDTMTEDYVISEIELNASFSADGKFMGIGVGGAASIKIKVTPDRGLQKTKY